MTHSLLTTENTRPGGGPMALSDEAVDALAQCVLWYNLTCYRRGQEVASIVGIEGGIVVRMPGGHEYDPKTWCRMYEDFKRRLGLPYEEVN